MTRKPSDNERMLAALREGPKTAHYFYIVLGLMAHSRAAVLRKRGHGISCTRIKGDGARGYLYTLTFDSGAVESNLQDAA